jgi:opacity protein-like surface antigen
MLRTQTRSVLLLALLACIYADNASAQYFRQSSYWKTHRQELTFGFGISNFLGELGGRNQIGAPFIWDLELSKTRPAASFSYRYHIARKQALRIGFTYGVMAGNDNLTEEPFRMNRNLSFKSDLFELQLVYELHLYREELGHVYDLRGVKGTKSSRVGLYFFAGVGVFNFNPQAQFNNAWVDLKPLGTEGQGLPGGAEEYSTTQVCIPMGVGLRKALSKQWSVGLELQYTKTFTDYIDDVSTNYYDNDAIRAAFGPEAAYLADPSIGSGPLYEAGLDPTATGQQRGDPDDLDAYLFLKAHLHYKLIKYRSGSKKYRARIRRQKIVF